LSGESYELLCLALDAGGGLRLCEYVCDDLGAFDTGEFDIEALVIHRKTLVVDSKIVQNSGV
jgi:hypothetical protein